jgi:hypothetical protein
MAAVGVSGGAKANKALAKRIAQVANLPHVRVGFLEGSTEDDGTSTPMVAAIQEFGAPRARIPPRPFFRTMIKANKASWGPATAALMQANNNDIPLVLSLMGQHIKEQLQDSIIALHAPALSPVTLMLRWMKWKTPGLKVTGKTVGEAAARVAAGKSSAGVSIKPLIDTGVLLKNVAFEVVTP